MTVKDIAARPMPVVAATTSWPEFATLWTVLLDEVWTCLRANGIQRGCRNVMLYRDDVPNVEVGVDLTQPCTLTGRVGASNLPAGSVAMTVHRGLYPGLADAHKAALDWCVVQGQQVTGSRWEVYGPHNDHPNEVWTEVYWLLS